VFQVFENFLNDNEKIQIENGMLAHDFPWFFSPITGGVITKNVKESSQLVHLFYDINYNIISNAFENVKNIFNKTKINYKKFIRIKANMTSNITNLKKEEHGPLHQDVPKDNYKSFIYYVNDSDGDTIFFDNDYNIINRFTPKRGTGILFNSNLFHCSSNPIINEKRIVINYIFEN